MSTTELQERVDRLERELVELREIVMKPEGQPAQKAWRNTFGKFKDDPLFEAIIQKGREYRGSQPYPEDVEE